MLGRAFAPFFRDNRGTLRWLAGASFFAAVESQTQTPWKRSVRAILFSFYDFDDQDPVLLSGECIRSTLSTTYFAGWNECRALTQQLGSASWNDCKAGTCVDIRCLRLSAEKMV